MIQQSIVIFGLLVAGVFAESCGSAAVSWTVTQNAGGTCPGGIDNSARMAFDSIISSRLATTSCPSVGTPVTTSCANDYCDQCSGSDDDGADDDFNLDDSLDDLEHQPVMSVLYGEDDNMLTILTYSITAELSDGDDPLSVMNTIEGQIELFFADKENARLAWITKARELGSDIPEDAQVTFSEPVVVTESIEVSHPHEFIDRHYHSNSNVRLGTWVAAGIAFVALVVSANYGMKAYKLKHGADVIEQEKAAEWANVEETAGELTMNPLARPPSPPSSTVSGTSGDVPPAGVRHRSGSGHVEL